jgi:hypothetical protein
VCGTHEETEDFFKKKSFFSKRGHQMQDDGGVDGPQVGAAGTDISSTTFG